MNNDGLSPSGLRINYNRPPSEINVGDVAKRIAAENRGTLLEIQSFRSAASQITRSTVSDFAYERFKDIKDASKLAKAAKETFETASQRSSGETRALLGAARHAKIASQIGFDLVRARINISQAQEAVRSLKSPAAASALAFMEPEASRLRSAFEAERHQQRAYGKIADALGGKLKGIGNIALEVEKVASRSVLGRVVISSGKVLTHSWVKKSLTVIGTGVAAAKGYNEAPTSSTAWKGVYGAVAAGTAYAHGKLSPLALPDLAIKKVLGDQYTTGKFFDDCTRNVTALVQAVTMGDSEPLNAVHKRSMQDNGSAIMKGYAMIGDAISRTSLVDTALTKFADWSANVPEDFRTSPSWWEAIESDLQSFKDATHGAAMTVAELAGG